MVNLESKSKELDNEIQEMIKEIDELEDKILQLKIAKKTPSNLLMLQELIEDSKEVLKKSIEGIEDLNYAYAQRIKC